MTTTQITTQTLNQRTYYSKHKDAINQKRRAQYQPKKRGLSLCPIHNLKYFPSKLKCSKCRSKEYWKMYREKNRSKINENSLKNYHRKRGVSA